MLKQKPAAEPSADYQNYHILQKDDTVSASSFAVPERSQTQTCPTATTAELADAGLQDGDTSAVASDDKPITDTPMVVKSDDFRILMKMLRSTATTSS